MATTSFSLSTTQWTDLGVAPAFIQIAKGGPVLLVCDSVAPTSLNPAAITIGAGDVRDANITLTSGNVYARSSGLDGGNTSVVVAR